MRKQEGMKSKARYISQVLKVHYKNIVKLVVEYSGHIFAWVVFQSMHNSDGKLRN
jgi:hypothetical protein